MMFKDRTDAAMRLIPLLEKYRSDKAIVLAIPRGGVPVGFYIAHHFGFPLDILLAKKIGHPDNEELAVGAVTPDNYLLDPRFDIPADYIEVAVSNIKAALLKRRRQFMGDRPPADIRGKTVIVVDDGIATGNTVLAAIQLMRDKQPAKIVVAVPVAPRETVKKLKPYADDVVCAAFPVDFFGIGQFYRDFTQVSDAEVLALLEESRHWQTAGG